MLLLIDVTAGDVIGLDRFAYRLIVVPCAPLAYRDYGGLFWSCKSGYGYRHVDRSCPFAPGPNVGADPSTLPVPWRLTSSLKQSYSDPVRMVFAWLWKRASFPSGHSMFSMAFYGFLYLAGLAPREDRLQRWLFCFSFAFIIVMIGIAASIWEYTTPQMFSVAIRLPWSGWFFSPAYGTPLIRQPKSLPWTEALLHS